IDALAWSVRYIRAQAVSSTNFRIVLRAPYCKTGAPAPAPMEQIPLDFRVGQEARAKAGKEKPQLIWRRPDELGLVRLWDQRMLRHESAACQEPLASLLRPQHDRQVRRYRYAMRARAEAWGVQVLHARPQAERAVHLVVESRAGECAVMLLRRAIRWHVADDAERRMDIGLHARQRGLGEGLGEEGGVILDSAEVALEIVRRRKDVVALELQIRREVEGSDRVGASHRLAAYAEAERLGAHGEERRWGRIGLREAWNCEQQKQQRQLSHYVILSDWNCESRSGSSMSFGSVNVRKFRDSSWESVRYIATAVLCSAAPSLPSHLRLPVSHRNVR